MDLSTYQTLTGITVKASRAALVTAQIARTKAMLETMLGFTLGPDTSVNKNLYNELGKTTLECACPSIDTAVLENPDAVVKAYRLYRYNDLDKYFHVDPFTVLHKVKLVYVKPGASPNGVTIKTFGNDEVRVNLGRDGFSKYIEHCLECLCSCGCRDCVQLAVDADWLWLNGNIPSDLKYLWTDMITWYSDSKYNIKSESIDTHSYTKFDKTLPESEPHNLAILRKYAGPYGSVVVMPT